MVTPPSTFENERAVIAACLENDSFAEVSQILTADDFGHRATATAFRWMTALFRNRRPVDIYTLSQAYGQDAEFAAVRAAIQDTPSTAPGSALHYAHILADKAATRRAITGLQKAAEALAMADTYADGKGALEAILTSVMGANSRAEIVSASEAVASLREKMASGKSHVEHYATGFPRLDTMFEGGPGRSHLVIVAGGTSAGKSTLAGNMVLNMAAAGVPCGIFSLEMGTDELTTRFALSKAHQTNSADEALTKVAGLPLWISDNADRTAENIRGAIRLMVLRYGIKVALVDYLQLLGETGDGRQSRERQVAAMSRHLKLAARESNVCVIALSQLNEEGRLRESKAIENDADSIIYIVVLDGREYLWLSKNRHGEKHGNASLIEKYVEERGIPLDFHRRNYRFFEAS